MSDTSDTAPSTPGSGALVNFKTHNHAMETFKKPMSMGVVKKKSKPKILTEEKYIEEISKIIQRDFFPDLEKLKAQNDYLDALEQKDYARMESIRAKYSGRKPTERNRSMTPETFETPSSIGERTPRNSEGSNTCTSTATTTSKATTTSSNKDNSKSVCDKHTLDSFLQAYTSEDNDSFQKIVDTADAKLRQKFAVLYNEETISADKLQKALTLPSIEQQFEEPDPMRKIETWTYQNKNSIMYTPDGVELTEAEKIDMANRKQVIQHSATRLHVNPFEGTQRKKTEEQSVETIATLSERVDADGNSVNQTNLACQLKRFDLVKTPSPRPGEAFSPLMTWGEIEGTPFRLDGSDTPVRPSTGPSFKINESSRRETIALALAEKVGEKIRAQKQKAMDTARRNISSPFIRSNMERLASMSPAARNLATSKLGLRTTPSIMTPSPIRTPTLKNKSKTKALPTRPVSATKKIIHATSPSIKPKTPASSLINNTKTGTLTDDLLQIPTKRSRAADFF